MHKTADKPAEQRRWVRVPARIPVSITLKQQNTAPIQAEILNISPGGAFVKCQLAVPIGAKIELEIHFRETKLLEAKVIEHELFFNQGPPLSEQELSIVRWTKAHPDGGFGVEFVHLKSETRHFVDALLRYFRHLAKAGVSFTNPK